MPALTPNDEAVDTIKQVLERIENYLLTALKHRNRTGIDSVLFSLTEIYRPLSLSLNTELYTASTDRFMSCVNGMKLIINYYGRLGRILIDEGVEEGFQTYVGFATDMLGEPLFDYPQDIDYERAAAIWHEIEEIGRGLMDSKLRTLFLVCSKAIEKKYYSLIYSLVEETETGHPRVIDGGKIKLREMLGGDRLEKFWADSVSTKDNDTRNVFGFLRRPVAPISQCYLVLRSYAHYKGVRSNTIVAVPDQHDKKIELYYVLESYLYNRPFLDDAYNELLRDHSPWDELFKGKFIDSLQKTKVAIDADAAVFEQRIAEIKKSLPLDEAKKSGFRQEIVSAFEDVRKNNYWIRYSFKDFPQEPSERKSYKRIGFRSLLPRDPFVLGLNAYGDVMARQFGGEMAEAEVERALEFVSEIASNRTAEGALTQELLLMTLGETFLGSKDLVVILHPSHMLTLVAWPMLQGYMIRSAEGCIVKVGSEDYKIRFFFGNAFHKDKLLVLPMGGLKIEAEQVPLIEINEKFRFVDYKQDATNQVEFIVELIVKSIFVEQGNTVLSISFLSPAGENSTVSVVTSAADDECETQE